MVVETVAWWRVGSVRRAGGGVLSSGATIGGLDSRFVKLPKPLGDDKAAWPDWRFDIENMLSLFTAHRKPGSPGTSRC